METYLKKTQFFIGVWYCRNSMPESGTSMPAANRELPLICDPVEFCASIIKERLCGLTQWIPSDYKSCRQNTAIFISMRWFGLFFELQKQAWLLMCYLLVDSIICFNIPSGPPFHTTQVQVVTETYMSPNTPVLGGYQWAMLISSEPKARKGKTGLGQRAVQSASFSSSLLLNSDNNREDQELQAPFACFVLPPVGLQWPCIAFWNVEAF